MGSAVAYALVAVFFAVVTVATYRLNPDAISGPGRTWAQSRHRIWWVWVIASAAFAVGAITAAASAL